MSYTAADFKIGDRVITVYGQGKVIRTHPQHGVKVEPDGPGLCLWELPQNVRKVATGCANCTKSGYGNHWRRHEPTAWRVTNFDTGEVTFFHIYKDAKALAERLPRNNLSPLYEG